MKEWWQWSPIQGSESLGFAIIGVVLWVARIGA